MPRRDTAPKRLAGRLRPPSTQMAEGHAHVRQRTRALAIVARYPWPGSVKTRLAAAIGAEAAAHLYAAFLRDLARRFRRAGQHDGYMVIWAHTPGPGDLRDVVGRDAELWTQRGDDFAARLYHLAVDLAAQGYQRIVVISSDAPQLPARAVREAFAGLERAPVVLSPADDGGYSLIGLRAAPAPPDLFRGIQMSTPHVCADTLARAATLGLDARLLPPVFDVDELVDLRRLARALQRPHSATVAVCPHTRAFLDGISMLGMQGSDGLSAE